jgi:hypothetical protein
MEMHDDGSYPTVLKATGNRANVQIDNEGAVHWIAGSDTRITDNAVVGESAIQANFRDAPPARSSYFCQFGLFNATALFGLCSEVCCGPSAGARYEFQLTKQW